MKIRQNSIIYRFANWQKISDKPMENGCDILINSMLGLLFSFIALALVVMGTGMFGLFWLSVTQAEIPPAGLPRLFLCIGTGIPAAVVSFAVFWLAKKWCDRVTIVITKKS